VQRLASNRVDSEKRKQNLATMLKTILSSLQRTVKMTTAQKCYSYVVWPLKLAVRFFRPKTSHNRRRLGLHFRPQWGAYSAPPDLAKTTARSLFNSKVIGQGQMGFWFFCVHQTAATRGQYLALSKAWRSCFPYVGYLDPKICHPCTNC